MLVNGSVSLYSYFSLPYPHGRLILYAITHTSAFSLTHTPLTLYSTLLFTSPKPPDSALLSHQPPHYAVPLYFLTITSDLTL